MYSYTLSYESKGPAGEGKKKIVKYFGVGLLLMGRRTVDLSSFGSRNMVAIAKTAWRNEHLEQLMVYGLML